jgi:hypothetical protein
MKFSLRLRLPQPIIGLLHCWVLLVLYADRIGAQPPENPPVIPGATEREIPSLIGKIVYYAQRDGKGMMCAIDPAGGEEINIGPSPISTQRFSLSGSARIIVYGHGGNVLHAKDASSYEIWSSNLDGSNKIRLTNDELRDDDPSLSEAGKKITWLCRVDGKSMVFAMNLDGSNRVQLSPSTFSAEPPVISPDGQFVVFAQHGNLYRVRTDGTELKLITEGEGTNSKPAISPDGKTLVYTHRYNHMEDIFRMNIDGSNQTSLTHLETEFGPLVFSSNGRQIAFRSNFQGVWKLYRMNLDGSGMRVVLENSDTTSYLCWPGNETTPVPELKAEGAIPSRKPEIPPDPLQVTSFGGPSVKRGSSPPFISGTAQLSDDIKNVTLCLSCYGGPEGQVPAGYWNWKQSIWQHGYDPLQSEGSASGTTEWKMLMPSLARGYYAAIITATTAQGATIRSKPWRFNVIEGPSINYFTGSNIIFWDIKMLAAEDTLKLRFSGSLDAEMVGKKIYYAIYLNEKYVQAISISYDAKQYVITLKLPAGSLRASNPAKTVKIRWSLRDLEDKSVSGTFTFNP